MHKRYRLTALAALLFITLSATLLAATAAASGPVLSTNSCACFSLNTTISAAAGDTITLQLANWQSEVTKVTDSGGDSWVRDSSVLGTNSNRAETWSAVALASSTTVTVFQSQNVALLVAIDVWPTTKYRLDVQATASSSTSTTPSAGPLTTNYPNEILLATISAVTGTYSTPTGFTLLWSGAVGSDYANTQWSNATATGSYSFNDTGPAPWALSFVALAPITSTTTTSTATSTINGTNTTATVVDAAYPTPCPAGTPTPTPTPTAAPSPTPTSTPLPCATQITDPQELGSLQDTVVIFGIIGTAILVAVLVTLVRR